MKYAININQAGVVDAGLHTKTDMVDWALLDYIFGWQQNPKAKTLNGKVWLNYSHILTEMPLLGLNTKSSISNRIKKLRELNLIETNQSPVDQRLYVKTSESYFAITQFSAVCTVPQNNQTVQTQEHPVPEKAHSIVNQDSKSDIKNSFSSYPAGAEKTETVLTLTPEQQEVFDWAATHTSKSGFSWCTATVDLKTFLHVYNFEGGKLKAQFDAHKKARETWTVNGLNSEDSFNKQSGGHYETRGKFNQSPKLSRLDSSNQKCQQMLDEWNRNNIITVN